MQPKILSIGTAFPPFSFSQQDVANIFSNNGLSKESSFLKKVYQNSCIENRYSVLSNPLELFSLDMTERNEIYKKEAPLLAEKSVIDAFTQWEGKKETITHVISISCTGAITPGLECLIAQKFKLSSNVSLIGLNFMGCHGAFKGLKLASALAKENPKHRILVLSTELCSLHLKGKRSMEAIVIESLFGDGSGALIVGKEEKGLFTLLDSNSTLLSDSEDEMRWDAASDGFSMRLSAKVPTLLKSHIVPFVKKFTEDDLSKFEWAIHPGGRAIVEEIEKTLSVKAPSSWNVLKNIGNVSSATLIHVLKDIHNRNDTKKKIIALGFGPGLSIEGLLLEKT